MTALRLRLALNAGRLFEALLDLPAVAAGVALWPARLLLGRDPDPEAAGTAAEW